MSTETIEETTYGGSETEIISDAIDGLFEPNQAISINTGGDKATIVKVRNIVTRYKKNVEALKGKDSTLEILWDNGEFYLLRLLLPRFHYYFFRFSFW